MKDGTIDPDTKNSTIMERSELSCIEDSLNLTDKDATAQLLKDSDIKFDKYSSGVDKLVERRSSVRVHNDLNCVTCDESFSDASQLRDHLMNVHADGTTCDDYDSDERLEGLTEEDDSKFPCDVCTASFSRYALLRNHRSSHDINNTHGSRVICARGSYFCDICGKVMVYKSMFNHHMKNHQRQSFEKQSLMACRYCPRVLRGQYEWRKHRACHTQSQSFQCPVCSKPFTVLALVQHLRASHHSLPDPLACRQCARVLKNEKRLRWHRWRDHGEGLHEEGTVRSVMDQGKGLREEGRVRLGGDEMRQCIKCGGVFDSGKLTDHWKTFHSLACGLCNLVYISQCERVQHWSTQHGMHCTAQDTASSISPLTPHGCQSVFVPPDTGIHDQQTRSTSQPSDLCYTPEASLALSGVTSVPHTSSTSALSPLISLSLSSPCTSVKQEPSLPCQQSAQLMPMLDTMDNMKLMHKWLPYASKAAAQVITQNRDPPGTSSKNSGLTVRQSPVINKKSISLANLAARAKALGAVAEKLVLAKTDKHIPVHPKTKSGRRRVECSIELSEESACFTSVKCCDNDEIENTGSRVSVVNERVEMREEEDEGRSRTRVESYVECVETISAESMTDDISLVVDDSERLEPVMSDASPAAADAPDVIPVCDWRRADMSIFEWDDVIGCDDLIDTVVVDRGCIRDDEERECYVCTMCGQVYDYELYVRMCFHSHCIH